ncbi:MAG: hypothetical protein KDB14_19040 [Planctomycetales bacterium]|nr:hypothetical protein [Planctomycetales bacterium]
MGVTLVVGWLALLPARFGLGQDGPYGPSHAKAAPRRAELPEDAPTGLRHPVAVCLSRDGRWAYTANERSGTLSVVDLPASRSVAELPLGGRPSAMVWVDDRTLAVADEQRHRVVLLRVAGDQIERRGEFAVARHPVGLLVTKERTLIVASLWSRRLTRIELGSSRDANDRLPHRLPPLEQLPAEPAPALAEESVATRTLDLPWSPRCLLQLPNGQLLVGDAFGGRLGLVDLEQWRFVHEREFPAHNIRGLALSVDGTKVVIAHQMLNDLANTVRNDVHWGLLMSNDLRYVPVATMLKPAGDIYRFAHMHPLGEAGNATSDPAGLAIAPDGTAIVTLGGVGELAIGREEEFSLGRLRVGARPTAIAIAADGKRAAIANTFDDSISLLDIAGREVTVTIPLGAIRKLSQVERGERLFYDGELSHDRWMSCHSCHPDGHTNGQRNDNLSDFNTFGAPKRVLSLLGKGDTAPFAWNGSAKDLPSQIANSITHTMQSDQSPRERDVAALNAFLGTLPPPPALDAAREALDAESVARGRAVFENRQCATCHAPPTFTSPRVYDVGLKDELGHREFNPPSLRGVSQRGPFFHDGRAPDLKSIFAKHRHQLDEPLTERELIDLLSFLRSL